MIFQSTAVHVYDTPARTPVPAPPRPWGRIGGMLLALVLALAAIYIVFGIVVQVV